MKNAERMLRKEDISIRAEEFSFVLISLRFDINQDEKAMGASKRFD